MGARQRDDYQVCRRLVFDVRLAALVVHRGWFREETDSFLAESALETHCFVLGGNEFHLRVLVCDAKRYDKSLIIVYIIFPLNKYYVENVLKF